MSAKGSTAIERAARCDAVTMVGAPSGGVRTSVAEASACASCAAAAKRSSGARASARRRARSTGSGTSGRTARTDRAGSVNRRTMIAWTVGPVNGGSPASIS